MRIIQSIKNFFHLVQAIIANIYYGFPSRKLKVIGVTGTDGKTTTTHLIYHLLKSAGKKVSMISTVYGKVGKEEFDTGLHTTTPSSLTIQLMMRKAVASGDQYFVLETTSHALDQNRVFGINFEIGVLTNITHEHLDYHQSYEQYLKTKERLLEMAKIAIVNKEDKSYEFLSQKLKVKSQKYNSKLKILDKIQGLTNFNRQNYSAAYSVGKQLGLSDKQILKAMKSFQLPPGRLELVYDGPFKVIIDFAHTPNALRKVLPEIRKNYLSTGGRLIHVFGAAGQRDATKRPLMGEVSSRYADLIILTEEDYRTEEPKEISRQIASGVVNGKPHRVIINREKAIEQAIYQAKKNDIILITGKAHEKSLCRGKKEYPWDEFEAVRKAVNSRK
jgi:UDP-N-acetylmuramoyl-L-alanyl-D-glutamate--2,6-diaminopimelate ligase